MAQINWQMPPMQFNGHVVCGGRPCITEKVKTNLHHFACCQFPLLNCTLHLPYRRLSHQLGITCTVPSHPQSSLSFDTKVGREVGQRHPYKLYICVCLSTSETICTSFQTSMISFSFRNGFTFTCRCVHNLSFFMAGVSLTACS